METKIGQGVEGDEEEPKLPDLKGMEADLQDQKEKFAAILKKVQTGEITYTDQVKNDLNSANTEIHRLEREIADTMRKLENQGWSIWRTKGGGRAIARLASIPKGDSGVITFRAEEVLDGYDGLKEGATFVNTGVETAPSWAKDAVQNGVFTFHGVKTIGKNGKSVEVPVPH